MVKWVVVVANQANEMSDQVNLMKRWLIFDTQSNPFYLYILREMHSLIERRNINGCSQLIFVPLQVRKYFSRSYLIAFSLSIEKMNIEADKTGNFVQFAKWCVLYVRFLVLLHFSMLFVVSILLFVVIFWISDGFDVCVWMCFAALAPPSIQFLIRFECILRFYVTHFIFLLRITSPFGHATWNGR